MTKEAEKYVTEYTDIEDTTDTTSDTDQTQYSSQTTEVTFSPAEEKARQSGWVPKDDWSGEPDDWVDYKEFNVRGELMSRITKQSDVINKVRDELKETRETLKKFGEHHQRVAELEYQKALKDLKSMKADALREQDHETVIEIDEQIDELKAERKQFAKEAKQEEKQTNKTSSLVDAWVQDPKNDWYKTDKARRVVADAAFVEYLELNDGDFAGALAAAEKEVRKEFPHKFKTSPVDKQSVAEGSNPASRQQKTTSKTKFTVRDLDSEQANVAQNFVKMGLYKNAQEYVDELVELGELS